MLARPRKQNLLSKRCYAVIADLLKSIGVIRFAPIVKRQRWRVVEDYRFYRFCSVKSP
jgi:hypothetical protein